MLVMHGTSSSNVNSILMHGICPRNGNGTWAREEHTPSIMDHVYFTNSKTTAEFYSFRTAIISNSDCCIISVDVDETNLFPDENLFNETFLLNKDDVLNSQKKVIENKSLWKKSLDTTNKVSHKGVVEPNRIRSIMKHNITESIFFPMIEHQTQHYDIDVFTNVFNCFMTLSSKGFFKKYKDQMELLMKRLTIYPIVDKSDSLYGQCFLLDGQQHVIVKGP
jgi:hypothetical protein